LAKQLSILSCKNYLKEIEYVIDSVKWKGIDVVLFQTQCNNCLRHNFSELRVFADKYINSYRDVRLLCSEFDLVGCSGGDSKSCFTLCQSILCGSSLLNHYIQRGYYVLTAGWLKNWRRTVVEEWGFEGELGKEFFKESASKLLLLDSGIYEGIDEDIREFSQFTGLEYDTLHVGMDHFRQVLLNIYNTWVISNQKDLINKCDRRVADYALVFELLPQIATIRETKELIYNAFELFVMFTGATKLAFLPVNEKAEDIIYYRQPYQSDLDGLNPFNFSGDIKIKESGYILKIIIDNKILGFMEVDGVLFNEYLENYVQLSTFVGRILALSLLNASNYEKVIELKQDAEIANKVKSQFLANMSHEIRTPINGIMGFLQLMDNTQLDAQQKRYIEIIKKSTDNLLTIINGILDISKIEAGKLELENTPFNLQGVIEMAVIPFSTMALQKGLKFNLLIDPDVPKLVSGDPTRLSQVIGNLVSNGVKFTNEGEVSTEVLLVGEYDWGYEISFSIKDTGIGFTKNDMEKLFVPFTQIDPSTTRKFGGTGLGLAICRNLVEMMGGSITASSDKVTGTDFTFTVKLNKISNN
jgi:signal transduction histidine kinase